MSLLEPIWLLLAVPLGAWLWWWSMPSRSLAVLRVLVLGFCLLGLARLVVELPSRDGTVVVVLDRSLSMPQGVDAQHQEIVELVQGAMGLEDRLAVVTFGHNVRLEHPPQIEKFSGFVQNIQPDASNLHSALDMAVNLIEPETPGRVLVISDGRWTGRDPVRVAARAAARGIAIDHRLVQRPSTRDLSIRSVEAPSRVGTKEAFMLLAWVDAPVAQEARYRLTRNGKLLTEGVQRLGSGLNRLVFRDAIEEASTVEYLLSVKGPQDDPIPENNRARILVAAEGTKPLLVVSHKDRPQLVRLLSEAGLKTKHLKPSSTKWDLTELSNYSAVWLEDVPSTHLGRVGMMNLSEWVRKTGAGLIMSGGPNSFGPGGYFQSPLEPLMPVSMELRQEHRKHSMAIAIALDRSGSMTMPVGAKTKMDLANLASSKVVEMLGPNDRVGVLAVDSSPHLIVKMQKVDNPGSIKKKILRIDSMGGGIFVYEALSHAAKMLQGVETGARHMILFADAADAEEPGDYKALLDKCRKAGITCSVIGLGKKTDVDAALLRDIAQRGGGRVYFTENAKELPRLFAQDTFVVARSSFIEEQTPLALTPALIGLTGRSLAPKPHPAGGYNLTYLRPGAQLSMQTRDEYRAPFLATWQAELGRSLAYAGQIDGRFTGPMAQWPRYGDLISSMARWAVGHHTGGDARSIVLTQQVHDGIQHVQLHLDPNRKRRHLPSTPKATVLRGVPGQEPRSEHRLLGWTSADRLELSLPLRSNETVLTTVNVPGRGPVTLPPVGLAYSPEFKPQSESRGLSSLGRLSELTLGRERTDLGAIWSELPRLSRHHEWSTYLFLAAVLLFLLEVLERRTGWMSWLGLRWNRSGQQQADAPAASSDARGPVSRKKPSPRGATRPVSRKKADEQDDGPQETAAEKDETAAQESGGGVLSALEEAKKRSEGRLK